MHPPLGRSRNPRRCRPTTTDRVTGQWKLACPGAVVGKLQAPKRWRRRRDREVTALTGMCADGHRRALGLRPRRAGASAQTSGGCSRPVRPPVAVNPRSRVHCRNQDPAFSPKGRRAAVAMRCRARALNGRCADKVGFNDEDVTRVEATMLARGHADVRERCSRPKSILSPGAFS